MDARASGTLLGMAPSPAERVLSALPALVVFLGGPLVWLNGAIGDGSFDGKWTAAGFGVALAMFLTVAGLFGPAAYAGASNPETRNGIWTAAVTVPLLVTILFAIGLALPEEAESWLIILAMVLAVAAMGANSWIASRSQESEEVVTEPVRR